MTLVPAGHVLGSAQAVVRWKGLTMVVSGDYKRRRDPTCPPFEPVPCDVFITEATFGLPVFRHPDDRERDRPPAALGGPVPGAQPPGRRLCARQGAADHPPAARGRLGPADLRPRRAGAAERALRAPRHRPRPAGARHHGGKKPDFAGQIIIAPPSATQDRWSRRFPDPVTAFASGWMQVRARARQRGVELPLVISDHADWDELTATVDELRPGELWITHGREEALARWAELHGVPARALALVGYEEEDDD